MPDAHLDGAASKGEKCFRRGSYRPLYFVDEQKPTVTVTAISHRADPYRS